MMKIYIQKIVPIWIDITNKDSPDIEEYDGLGGHELHFIAIKGMIKINGFFRSYKKTYEEWESEIQEYIKNIVID